MKFGKTFISHQVPEWSTYYMNYKGLKKEIKALVSLQASISNTDGIIDTLNNSEVKALLAGFFFSLDRNVEKVDDFYNKQYSEYERRLKRLTSILGNENNPNNDLDNDEIDEIVGVLLELRNSFRNMKWFGELNKRGFTKILKKLDKKTGTNQQQAYLNARINALPFANETDILKCLSIINSFLIKFGPKVEDSEFAAAFPNILANGQNNNGSMSILSNSASVKSIKSAKSIDNGNHGKAEEFVQFVINDDAEGLSNALISDYRSPVLAPLRLLISLLNKAALLQSFKVIDQLLEVLPLLGDSSDISGRNFFHHHVIALGKKHDKKQELQKRYLTPRDNFSITPATPPDHNSRLVGAFGSDGINSNDSPNGLLYIFEHLPLHLKFGVLQKDNYKRTPLHYAAQYGLMEVSKIMIDYLIKWDLWKDTVSIDDVNAWGDLERLTPLHLAVLGTHPKTAGVLIKAINKNTRLSSPSLLLIAARLDSPELLQLLLSCNGIDIDYVDSDSNETALYISCKLNLVKSVKFLLENGANTEIGERTFGWTPIFVAASEGFQDVVKLLIQYGAVIQISDESGWSPLEHATLRGHLECSDLLVPPNYNAAKVLNDPYTFFPPVNMSSSKSSSVINTPEYSNDKKFYQNSHISTSSIDKLPEGVLSENQIYKSFKNNMKRSNSPPPPVKSFGHRYLQQNESLILITLGTTDLFDSTSAITLNRVPISKAYSTELDTALSLSIRAKDIDVPPVVLDLPLDDNNGSATDPITFKCIDKDPTQSTIFFDIVPTYSYGENKDDHKPQQVLGRAVALLNTAYTSVGPQRRSLNNIITVPILEYETLEILGSIRFEVMFITPFSHPKMTFGRTETYWKSLVSTRVIGHRGLGKNSNLRNSLQLGENTVESFIAAASLGASYVEFDVQLTKDHIPVVYHDFLVAESGMDIPMHALTAEQFLGLNNVSEQDSQENGLDKKSVDDEVLHMKYRSKSFSMRLQNGENLKNFSNTFNERMKLTKTWKDKGFKGNSRGTSIASSFATLAELFKKLPKNVGFNIECKYPMLDEAEHEDMGQVGIDLNFWVDTVLNTVYEHADGRDIIFSSFHPDICVLLSLKQPSIPILFLTEAGTAKMCDIRAASLQSAIRFAKKWNLLGIVSASAPLVKCPRLANVVKTSGLVCVTYGTPNNDPENANLQMLAGVDAVIVDSVLAVRKGLRKEEGFDSTSDLSNSNKSSC